MTTKTTIWHSQHDKRELEIMIEDLDRFYNSITQPLRSRIIKELQKTRDILRGELEGRQHAD